MLRALQEGEECWGLPQYLEEPRPLGDDGFLGLDSSGGIGTDDEGSANISGCVPYRAVTECPVDIDQFAVAIDGDELVFAPVGFAPRHHIFNQRTDDVPDLRPAVRAALPERGRMLVGTNAGAVCVVVELNELVAPP